MKSLVLVLMLAMSGSAYAQVGNLPQYFNFDGYLLDASSNPYVGPVNVTFQIYNSAATCLVFEESHAGVPVASDGSFSLKVGSGSRASPGTDGGLSLKNIFQNNTMLRASATTNCTPGFTPTSGEARKLRVTVGGTVLTPDYTMSSAPMATVAESLQGKAATDFVTTNGASAIDGSLQLQNYSELRLHGTGMYYTGFKGSPAMGTNTIYTMPSGDGANQQCLATDGAGNLQWRTVAAAGSGVQVLNGLSGPTQSFAIGVSSLQPLWDSSASTHTLNIPMAHTAGVASGLVSKAEFDLFNSKMNSVTGFNDNLMRYDGANWVATNAITVSIGGEVTVSNPPTTNNSVATKIYVDTATSDSVSSTGGSMNGTLTFTGFGTASNAQVALGAMNNGLYIPVSNQIGVTAGGIERMRVTNTGVGFGTSNPSSALEVVGGFKVGPSGTGSAVNHIKNYPALSCTGFVSISAGATGTCTASLASFYLADNLSINCLPENAAPTQAMIHSCYLSANGVLTIAVHNIGAGVMTPPNFWNVTVTKF